MYTIMDTSCHRKWSFKQDLWIVVPPLDPLASHMPQYYQADLHYRMSPDGIVSAGLKTDIPKLSISRK